MVFSFGACGRCEAQTFLVFIVNAPLIVASWSCFMSIATEADGLLRPMM